MTSPTEPTEPRSDPQADLQRPEAGSAPHAPAWQSFGVPYAGEPDAPAYTPAMRERPRGDLTQPIDTEAARTSAGWGADHADAPQPSASPPGWWSTPDTLGATEPTETVTPSTSSTPFWASTPAEGPDAAAASFGPAYGPPAGDPHPAPSWAPGVGGDRAYAPSGPDGYGTSALPLQSGGPDGYPPQGPGSPGTLGTTTWTGAPRNRPDGRRQWAALAALAIVAALLGGGVALAGQQLLNRGTSLGSAVPAPGPGSTSRPDGSIAKIAADALPSVVTIRIKTSSGSGTGSGFVIDQQGHILTNNHVVAAAGGSGTIAVELNSGKTVPATVVGADASYDLAVIKIDATDVRPLQFGASKDVVVGDGVIAVGAPLGLDATVTSGIVSALNRPVTPGDSNDQSFINAIQTDAAINPGNSGGPLLDMNGRVIGINSAIARIPGSTSDSGGSIGVGFAIPSDQAAKTAQQLITTGKADHPALGVRVDRGFTGDGAKIAASGVSAGSAADKAGLKEGDVITEFEGKKVTDADALIVAVRARSVGDTVSLMAQRGNQTVALTMTLQAATG